MDGRIEPRHFLYLDDPLISELLAQIEEGEFDDYRYEHSTASQAEAGGRLGVPVVGVSASGGQAATQAVRYAGRLTPASRFARFLRLLSERRAIVDHSHWTRLRLADFVLSDAELELTGVTRLALGFHDLDLSERLFRSQGKGERAKASQAWAILEGAARRLARRPKSSRYRSAAKMLEQMQPGFVPVLARLPGDEQFEVMLRLRRERLRVDHPTMLEGKTRVLFKVTHLLAQGEVVSAAEPFPVAKPLGDAFLQGLTESMVQPDVREVLGRLSLQYPGALALPIAIFQ